MIALGFSSSRDSRTLAQPMHLTPAACADRRPFLAVISPGLLGSGYFRDVADVLAGGGPPDVEKIGEVMSRHGLTPAPPA